MLMICGLLPKFEAIFARDPISNAGAAVESSAKTGRWSLQAMHDNEMNNVLSVKVISRVFDFVFLLISLEFEKFDCSIDSGSDVISILL